MSAPEWTKELRLYVDLDADGEPLVSISESTVSTTSWPDMTNGDCRMLYLYFGRREGATGWTYYALATGDTVTVVGKVAAGTGSALFSAASFSKGGTADTPFYQGTLDLNTVALDSALTGLTLATLIDIEIQTADGNTRATFQAACTIKEEMNTGVPPTVEGGPSYYTQAQVDAKISVAAGKRLVVDSSGNISVETIA